MAPKTLDMEVLVPKELRSLQRFQPLIVAASPEDKSSSNTFIPRQRLLLCYVYKNKISLYSYNCSRDIIERLHKQINQLGHWFNARSAMSMTIVTQKLGLKHNQAFYRQKTSKTKKTSNIFMGNDAYIEGMVNNFATSVSTFLNFFY